MFMPDIKNYKVDDKKYTIPNGDLNPQRTLADRVQCSRIGGFYDNVPYKSTFDI